MTKRETIDEIVCVNQSADPAFLALFGEDELEKYLQRLRMIQTPRLQGDRRRFDKYFENCPTISCAPRSTMPVGDDFTEDGRPARSAEKVARSGANVRRGWRGSGPRVVTNSKTDEKKTPFADANDGSDSLLL